MPGKLALPLPMLSRIAAAPLSGYAFTRGFAAVVIPALAATGTDFHEAEQAAMLLAFLVFLGMFLWAFAARNFTRIWAVVAGGGAAMTLPAWALQPGLRA